MSGAWVFDSKTGELVSRIGNIDHEVRQASFSPDGKRLVTASGDTTVGVWDIETGTEIARLRAPETKGMLSAIYSPDGGIILGLPRESNVARIWPAWPYEYKQNAAKQLVDTFGPLSTADKCGYFIEESEVCAESRFTRKK